MEGLYSHMSLTAPSLSRCSFHSTLSSGVSPACMSIRSLSIPTGGSLFAGVPPPSLVRLCNRTQIPPLFGIINNGSIAASGNWQTFHMQPPTGSAAFYGGAQLH